ncbi:uncharacterized protein LOC113851391 isoform X2 [Abrus precatorius]|uniref:Uncharacterized protein LOC113851391 isoform X2 n=1 Tax=Abrus precatorius TaxID=3816 RepID=A0A8B8K3M6_ABRPR|nr:uncharacterized protein LOC113851391 isoform X2 [Abrus precatorius]
MEQDRRLELIDHAIQKLILDNRDEVQGSQHNHNHHDAEYQLALAHLLSVSQLEMLKGDETVKKQSEACVVQKTESENEDGGGSENEEIMKELKKVKRQNFVTHCLLSVMIVLTVVWQVSEVSLILKMKDGLSHPFRSFGNMLKGIVKVPDVNGQEDDNKQHPPPQESPSLPSLGLQNGKE